MNKIIKKIYIPMRKTASMIYTHRSEQTIIDYNSVKLPIEVLEDRGKDDENRNIYRVAKAPVFIT